MSLLEKIKRLFMSKKKKLILDIKKKHNKNITDSDINDYRRKHKMYPDSTSDNDILGLMLLGDLDLEIKSDRPRNTEVQTNSFGNYEIPVVTISEYNVHSSSSRSSKSSRNDDNFNDHSHHSGGYCSGSYGGSSDCGSSSSSCD